jgi:hypothetical protein
MKPHQSPAIAAVTTADCYPLKRECSKVEVLATGSSKRHKKDGIHFWLQLPDDVLGQIMMAATRDPRDLCGLEASCKALRDATSRCWRMLAKDHFNLVEETEDLDGKDLWNEGRALESLSEDRCTYVYFRNVDYDVFRQGIFFGCNTSIMVMSSSDHNTPHQHTGGFIPPSPIRIRDAATLKILANMDGSPNHKAVDVLGQPGNEVIVEYLDSCLKAYRNCKPVWEHSWVDHTQPGSGGTFPTDNWCLLPSERALLVVRDKDLHVFLVDESTKLPYLADVVRLEQVVCPTINWIDEGRAFMLHVRSGEVTFWKIHEMTKKLVMFRTMRLSVDESFSFVYAGSKHLVTAGAPDDDSIYVFDRNGKLLHTLLEDISKPHESHAWSPMNACVVKGCLLVTNSIMGAALCVWNMRTGRLIQRFEQSIDQGHCFRPGNNYSDGTWVHCLDQLPSFDFPFFLLADNDGSLFSWGFPADESQIKRMKRLEYQAIRENRG